MAAMDGTQPTAWDRVIAATDGHNVARLTVVVGEDRPWVYVECSCGEEFSEQWEFTDHIRRLTFAAVAPDPVRATVADNRSTD